MIRDITGCKQTKQQVEAALLESEARCRTILQTAMDGFWRVDLQGRLLEVNDAYCRMSGYSETELLALRILDLEASETAAATAAHIQNIVAQGEDRFESRHRRKDGSVFDVEISVQYRPSDGGCSVAFLRNISERKRTENELKENQARLALAMDQAHLADWEMDAATETFTFNDRFYALYATTDEREGGYQMPALVYAREFLPAEERQLVPKDVARLLAGEIDELQAEHHIRRRDGELRDIAVRINVVRDASGRVVGTRGSNQDITERKQAEQALRDAHWRLASTIEGTGVGTWEWHIQTGAVVFNERWAEIIGYTLAELAPISIKTWERLAHPEDLKQSAVLLKRHFAGELPNYDYECRIMHKDGYWVWVHDRGRVITRTGDGQPLMMFGTHSDITERKRAEESLRLDSQIMASMADGVYLIRERDRVIVYANDRFEKMFGYAPGELLGQPVSVVNAPVAQSSEVTAQAIIAELSRSGVWEGEIHNAKKDGTTFWCHARVTAFVHDSYGPVWIALHHDITDRKHTEAALRESEAQLRLSVRSVNIGLWDWDRVANIVYFSPEWKSHIGYRDDELPNRFDEWQSRLHPDDLEATLQTLHTYLAKPEGRYEDEFRLKHKDGSYRWISSHADVLLDADGKLVRMVGGHIDITRRKQSEEALRESEGSFREAQRLAHVGSWQWAVATDTVTWSEDLYRITGRNPELPAPSFAEMAGCYTPKSWIQLNATVTKTVHTGEPYELVLDIVRPDGTTRSTVVHGEAIRDASERIVGLHGTVQDITEQTVSGDRLRLLTTALEAAANGVVITDADGTILWVNAAFTMLTGYTASEAVGQNPRILKSGKHDPLFYRAMQATIAGGQVWHGEITNRRKDGFLYHEEMTVTPVQQAGGPITHFIAIKQNITERKKAEAKRGLMEIQLRQAQKLESIGQLAAGIAHEINTPTQYIGDNTRFLQDSFAGITRALGQYDRLLKAARQQQVTPQLVEATVAAAEATDIAYLMEEVPKSICQTLQGVASVAKIVRAMKDFSHPGSGEKTPADLNHGIESTVTVARNEWKYVADLDLVLDPQLPLVPCLPGEINQVVLNLVINAAHAIGDVVGDGAGGKGRILVSTRRQGDWAVIRVQDTGTGIREAARARVFDPFFTTKAVGKGTGQGLAIAYSVVVEQHKGTIEFETELGKGTTFIVRLPLHPGPVAQERSA